MSDDRVSLSSVPAAGRKKVPCLKWLEAISGRGLFSFYDLYYLSYYPMFFIIP